MDKSSDSVPRATNTLKMIPTRWADYPSDEDSPNVFKMEKESNRTDGKNKETPVKKEEKQDNSVTEGDDSSPIRSKHAKEKPVDIHSKTN